MEPDASAGVNVVEMNMSQESAKDDAAAREHLSAMADGELDDAVVGRACAAWHADASHRATWHAYHLIGDVMRSDDLASDAGRDAAFLGALRARLATEPVVLAPEPLQANKTIVSARAAAASRRRVWSWMAPTAVAAGFVAVAGVLVVTRGAGSLSGPPATPALAQAQSLAPVAVAQRIDGEGAVASPDPAAEPAVLVLNGQLIRDVQLDRYLSAHKQFAGSSALGVPSAFLRSATADATSR
jgi:sigma-E factor negative regulatory protein RseA